MKKLFTTILLIAISTFLFSQPPIKWQKNYGGSGSDQIGDASNYYDAPNRSIVATHDGGFATTGYSTSNNHDAQSNYGAADILFIKCDSSGNVQWSKSLGGSGSDIPTSIIATRDGGYAICGFTTSVDHDFTMTHGGYDVFIIKLDATGTLLWSKSYGGSNEDRAYTFLESTDGFIVGAMSKSSTGDVSSNHGDFDYWIFKTDVNGNLLNSHVYGGSGMDWVNGMSYTLDGGYMFCGFTSSTGGDITNPHGSYDYWVIKTDSSGTLKWQKTYGGSGDDRGTAIIFNDNYTFTFTGISTSTSGDITSHIGANDFWTVNIDTTGNINWQITTGTTASDEAYEVIGFWPDKSFILVGATYTGSFDYMITKIDSTGNLVWTRNVGGSSLDWALSATIIHSADILVMGTISSTTVGSTVSYGSYDLFVACFDNLSIGVNEIESASNFNLYPNPANDVINIAAFDDKEISSIEIFSTSSQKILFRKIDNSDQLQIDISSLPAGIYLVQLNSKNYSAVQRFVKE